MRKTMYFSSLIALAISIIILVEFNESNRLSLIAGILTSIGFALNLGSYFYKEQ